MESSMKRSTWTLWAITGAGLAFVAVDQLIKLAALAQLAAISYRLGTSSLWMDVVLSLNPGAFLSIGQDLPQTVKSVIFLCALAAVAGVIYWALSHWQQSPGRSAALYLIALGGGSNLIDRFFRDGHVVDYLVLNLGSLHTGVFNLADVAIMAGVAYLALSGFSKEQKALA
ncbi:signal peptidase II [Pseudomonas oryzihabitans]|uniref:Lipoprotein signal peptidase n=2 Tax=Pseudomonas oryzihabitans TaxID=47885 RepID=A0A2Z5A9T4_9PSED|nr:signal peptidase II [Pseudomonas oryzihabitans]